MDLGWRNGLLDFTHPDIQDWVVKVRQSPLRDAGLYDGIMYDYWRDTSATLNGYVPVESKVDATPQHPQADS